MPPRCTCIARGMGCALRGRKVSGDIVHGIDWLLRMRARDSHDPRVRVHQRSNDRRTHATTTSGNQRALARQLQIAAHGVISSEAILPRSSAKLYRRSTGLPGKFPVTRPVTIQVSPWVSSSSGSTTYVDCADAASFHAPIAAKAR